MDIAYENLWVHFVIISVAGLLIGLELREYRMHQEEESKIYIGNTRTYTFLSMLGYILYILDTKFTLYILGGAGFILIYAVFYHYKLTKEKTHILGLLIGLIVYSFGPMVEILPLWFTAMVLVSVIFVLNIGTRLYKVTASVERGEILTLSKLILLTSVILPLLSHKQISEFVPISPFKIWLAVVVVSTISYIGYILQRYIFPNKGYILAGILGGIYSSTATTIVLSKKSKNTNGLSHIFSSSIILATGMMYLRLLLIVAALKFSLLKFIALPCIGFFLLSAVMALTIYKGYKMQSRGISNDTQRTNPLEFKVAFLFALLFIAMTIITQYFTVHFGKEGLGILSFAVGFSDIDPFVLSVINGNYDISSKLISSAVLIAAGSNDLLKAAISIIFSDKETGIIAFLSLIFIALATIAYGIYLM